jgi:hypothetical protein
MAGSLGGRKHLRYAVQRGQRPRSTAEANIANYRRQLRRLGLAHHPRRSVATTEPAYYRWTQRRMAEPLNIRWRIALHDSHPDRLQHRTEDVRVRPRHQSPARQNILSPRLTIRPILRVRLLPWHRPHPKHLKGDRGYGYQYQKLRKALLPKAYGTPCDAAANSCSQARSCT